MESISILAFSDVHGKEDIVKFFVEDVIGKGLSFDFIIIAGDAGNPQKPWVFKNIIKIIGNLKKPVLYVKGNWDINLPEDELSIDLDRHGPFIIDDFVIIGHGRKISPYNNISSNKIRILVTHYPPFSIMDRGKKLEAPYQTPHSGLPEINYLISHYKPHVHIFGHSHYFGGIDLKFKDIVYINVARLDRMTRNGQYIGNYAYIKIDRKASVDVKWYFLNGVWRICTSCGKKVHLPASWSVCRKCANKRELKFDDASIPSKFRLKVSELSKSNTQTILDDVLEIPSETISNKESFEEFLDIVLLRKIIKILRKKHLKVIDLPKDKVIEFYGEKNDHIIIPFSEYLFSCNEDLIGQKLCTIMKFYATEKKAHLIWGLGKDHNSEVLIQEYLLIKKKALNKISDEVIDRAIKQGFNILLVDLQNLDEQR